jgi:AcrR family transcriptional regulator
MAELQVRAGRPRNHAIDEAVLKAGLEAFIERGYHRTSLTEIARRAGVRTPAIYRRWRTKAELALDVYSLEHGPDALPDTGSIRDDLTELLKQRLRLAVTPLFARVLVPVVMEASTDASIRAKLRRMLLDYREQYIEARIRKAIHAGQLRSDTDPAVLMNQLVGTVDLPLLFAQDLPKEAAASTIVDRLLLGFAGPVQQRSRPGARSGREGRTSNGAGILRLKLERKRVRKQTP